MGGRGDGVLWQEQDFIGLFAARPNVPCVLSPQGPVELGKESGSRVQKMLSIGSGVWVAWRDSTIELYHATTVTPVQKIEVKRTIERMIACE